MSAIVTTEKELDRFASEGLIAIRFQQNKAANFHYVLGLMSKAYLYQNGKLYLACFTRDHNSFHLLANIISEIRDWKSVTVYANGRPQRNRNPMFNMLQSYLTASACRDHKDHCHEVIEDPFVINPETRDALSIDILGNEIWNVEKRKERWLLPCKHLKGFLHLHTDDKPRAKEKLEALAIERNCNLCPYFRAENFRPTS